MVRPFPTSMYTFAYGWTCISSPLRLTEVTDSGRKRRMPITDYVRLFRVFCSVTSMRILVALVSRSLTIYRKSF
jgi:hypothetical protein